MAWKFMPPAASPVSESREACRSVSGAIGRGARGPWLSCGKIPYLQHLLDRSDSGDGILAELSDAIGKRSQQFVADINRAAAHARNHAGVFRLGAVQLARIMSWPGPRAPRSTPRISTSIGSGLVPVKTVHAVAIWPRCTWLTGIEACSRKVEALRWPQSLSARSNGGERWKRSGPIPAQPGKSRLPYGGVSRL